MDYTQLAQETVNFLKPYLIVGGGKLVAAGGKLVDDGMNAAREKLLGWLKGKLVKPSQSAALEDAVQTPQDDDAMEALQLQIKLALKNQEEFRKELLEILPKEIVQTINQTATVTGHANKLGQIGGSGSGNSVNIG